MAINYEFERHIATARQEGSEEAIKALEAQLAVFNALKNSGVVKELPRETKTQEVPVELQRFSDEAREALQKEGYVIHELTGKSIAALREAGNKFWSSWHRDYPDFEAIPSRFSEVAIKPDQLSIPESNKKTLAEQEAMVGEFSNQLSTSIPGVKAVIGEVSDYTELAFAHLSVADNEDYLFGEKYSYNYTRTKTVIGHFVAVVGYFYRDDGLGVDCWGSEDRGDNLFVSPLVVPAES